MPSRWKTSGLVGSRRARRRSSALAMGGEIGRIRPTNVFERAGVDANSEQSIGLAHVPQIGLPDPIRPARTRSDSGADAGHGRHPWHINFLPGEAEDFLRAPAGVGGEIEDVLPCAIGTAPAPPRTALLGTRTRCSISSSPSRRPPGTLTLEQHFGDRALLRPLSSFSRGNSYFRRPGWRRHAVRRERRRPNRAPPRSRRRGAAVLSRGQRRHHRADQTVTPLQFGAEIGRTSVIRQSQ